jgi:AcrR family transcriptional regulator
MQQNGHSADIRGDDRRERILSVAEEHFSARPYDEVSTVAIAQEAGVNRGWIHHEFGSKHALYVEVVRRLIRIPTLPAFPALDSAGKFADALSEIVARWLSDVEAHKEAYLAAQRIASGLAGDPEIQSIIDELREQTIDSTLAALFPTPSEAPQALRAMVAALGGFVGEVLTEWLQRGRLTRSQAHVLIMHATLSLSTDLPAGLARAGD